MVGHTLDHLRELGYEVGIASGGVAVEDGARARLELEMLDLLEEELGWQRRGVAILEGEVIDDAAARQIETLVAVGRQATGR